MTLNYNPYPAIRRAVILIAYDNGCVNRHTTEQDVLDNVGVALKTKFDFVQLGTVELYLSKLNADQLEELCCGEHVDPTDELSTLVDEVLNYAFDNLLP